MYRLIFAIVVLAGCFLGVRSSAFATTCSVPNTFSNGTIASAPAVNANFASLVTCGNTIDNTNIGPLGIYASQIIPVTLGEAVFGGAFGYAFNPGVAGQVPLSIVGATSQSADLLDVFSVGSSTKYVWVTSAGVLNTNQAPAFPGLALNSTTSNTVTSNTTGANDAFVFNANNASQPTSNLLNFKANGTSEVSCTMVGTCFVNGGLTMNGGVVFGANATSLTSGGGTHCGIVDSGYVLAQGGTFLFSGDTAGNAGVCGALKSTSSGATGSYVPPVYTAAGAAVASTAHITIGTFSTTTLAACGGGGTFTHCTLTANTVSLTGAGAFANTPSCSATATNGLGVAFNPGGSSFLVDFFYYGGATLGAGSTETFQWACIGT